MKIVDRCMKRRIKHIFGTFAVDESANKLKS